MRGNWKHGYARRGREVPEFKAWKQMLYRCTDPRCAEFGHYGGRGITVCEPWAQSFEAFAADVGSRPSAKHTIGRIDNERGYEPGNVRWETRMQQAQNRRSTVSLTFRGETLCAAEWARRVGMTRGRLLRRLEWGWSVERALTEPLRSYPRRA